MDGKLYIAAVLDCYNGEIVGLSMDDNMRKELWTRYYHTLYNTHHFMVRKERDGSLSCADPTCGRQDMRITFEEIIPHIFDIKRIRRVAEKPLNFGTIREAREVLLSHPKMRKSLLEKMNGCTGAKQKDAGLLARYISAMIDNRYLFRHYLQNRPSASDQDRQLFSDEFFCGGRR